MLDAIVEIGWGAFAAAWFAFGVWLIHRFGFAGSCGMIGRFANALASGGPRAAWAFVTPAATYPPVWTDMRAAYGLPDERHWPMDE